jgi:flagellar assembly protein FliH
MFEALPLASAQTVQLSNACASTQFHPIGQAYRANPNDDTLSVSTAGSATSERYARGFEDGQRAAEKLFFADREQFNNLLASASVLQCEPSEELAAVIREAVRCLVRNIVGSAEIDASWLNEQANNAAAIVAECDTARMIRVHPDDAELIDAARIGLQIVADPNAKRGSFRIECSQGWIEHGRAHCFEQIDKQLGLHQVIP